MNTASSPDNYLPNTTQGNRMNNSLPETLLSGSHQFDNRKRNNRIMEYINNLFRRIKGSKTPDIFTLFHAVEYVSNKGIFAFFFHNTTSSSLYINRPCRVIFNPSSSCLFTELIFKRRYHNFRNYKPVNL